MDTTAAEKKGESTETAEAPVPAEVKVIAEMKITMTSDGNCTVDGPLDDRQIILSMLSNASDISYEYGKQKALAEQRAAIIASQPPPKKYSKAWWGIKFAEAKARRLEAAKASGAKAEHVDPSVDEVSARLMAAKTEGLGDTSPGLEREELANGEIRINGSEHERARDNGPTGGTPQGGETKH